MTLVQKIEIRHNVIDRVENYCSDLSTLRWSWIVIYGLGDGATGSLNMHRLGYSFEPEDEPRPSFGRFTAGDSLLCASNAIPAMGLKVDR